MTFETILYSLIIPLFSFIIFFTFLILLLRNCVIGFDLPHVYLQRNCWVEVFAVLVREKRRIVVRERKEKKTFSPNVPLHIRSHSKTPLRYVREENYLAVQRERAMRISFFELPRFYLDDWGERGDLWKCTEESINLLKEIFFLLLHALTSRALFN